MRPHPAARVGIPALLDERCFKMGSYFTEETKGSKRRVRELKGSLIVSGGPYFRSRPAGRMLSPAVRNGTAPAISCRRRATVKRPPDGIGCRWEGGSFTKVNRGDKIRTCGLVVPNHIL